MKFLYELYDKDYFGITLFLIIAILIFLFLIILFFGKKDEKNRKLEETKRLELEAANGFKENKENAESLDIPIIEQPVLQKEETIVADQENNSIAVENQVEQMPNLDNVPNQLGNLEDSDNTTTETQDKEELVNDIELPVLDNLDIDNIFQTNLDEFAFKEDEEDKSTEENIEFKPVEEPKVEETKSNVEVAPKVEAPFSSVYINNELPKLDEKAMMPEIKKEEVSNQNNMFELPKKMEMPKLNEEQKEETKVEKATDFDSLFGGIETETYNINK